MQDTARGRAATAGTAKGARLEARITAEQKALLEQAAALSGRSLTDFVVSSAQEKDGAARSFYERYGFLRSQDREYRLFLPMATVARMVEQS